MKGRASLPGADELVRVTSIEKGRGRGGRQPSEEAQPEERRPAERVPSGRQRHDEKVTFYCTRDDLMSLERARLRLRSEHGVAADRGRIVRAALSYLLEDFEARGEDSILLRQLSE